LVARAFGDVRANMALERCYGTRLLTAPDGRSQ
jgi:hypothetical protein